MSGWIKLHRKLIRSDMYRQLNSKQRDIMITLLLMANYEESKWEYNGELYEIEPGQLVTSLEKIKENCASDVSIQNIRTCLLKLEKYGFLTNESTNRNRLITIVNWGLYQPSKENQQANQPTSNKQLTTNKKLRNKEDIYIAQFEQFWSMYPNKKGKQRAKQKWLVYCKNGELDFDEVIEGTKAYIKHCEQQDRFLKDGSTFINQRTWEDDWAVEETPSQQRYVRERPTPMPELVKATEEEAAFLESIYEARRQQQKLVTHPRFTPTGTS